MAVVIIPRRLAEEAARWGLDLEEQASWKLYRTVGECIKALAKKLGARRLKRLREGPPRHPHVRLPRD